VLNIEMSESVQLEFLPFTKEKVIDTLASLSVALELDLLHLATILDTKTIARNFVYLHETTSTMDVATALESKVPKGTLILAESQTHGKGRQLRKWSATSKENLYFTIILGFDDIKNLLKSNIAIPAAIAIVCTEFGLGDVGIKWPNDFWIKNKKISGMLINSSMTGTAIIAHAGVGININENMENNIDVRETATSVYNCLGKKVQRENFLARVCFHLENLLEQSFEAVQQTYQRFDILVGREVIVMPKKLEDPERYTAQAVGFSSFGNLIVVHEGVEKELTAEEVTIRPI